MKKLMMAAAIVCAAIGAHAATYNWSAVGEWVTADEENPLEVAVYAFDANKYSMATITAALEGGNLTALDNAINHGVVNGDGYIKLTGSTLTDNEDTPLTTDMFALIMDKKEGDFKYFYAVDLGSVEVNDTTIGDGMNFLIANSPDGLITGAVGGAGWTEVAPEPTSGLLLLIGVAGLALKRKRA